MIRHGIEVIRFIRDFRTTHPYGPTVREIAKGVGWRSTSTAHHVIDVLTYEGFVSQVPKIPRTINLTEKGVELLGSSTHG